MDALPRLGFCPPVEEEETCWLNNLREPAVEEKGPRAPGSVDLIRNLEAPVDIEEDALVFMRRNIICIHLCTYGYTCTQQAFVCDKVVFSAGASRDI